jgi:protoporphyrinogen oxidase
VVARKRIPEPSLFSLVVKTLTNRKIGQKHSEDLDAVESYYPPKGIGAISDRFNELILANGGKVELNSDLQSIAIDRKMNSKKVVRYKCAGNEKTLECDYIVSTIPINNLYSYIPAPDKKKVEDDIAVLSYRSIILLYMSIEIEKLFDAPWIYFNERDDPGLIFNRMYEVGNFSQEMISNKKGVVCLEITCYKGDSIWNSSDEELFNSCIAYLGKNNFLNRRQVSGIFTKRVEIAYPVFKKGYQPRLLRILRHLTEELGILSVGRQGLFSYANIDHCIDMGLKTGLLFDSGDIGSYPNFFKMYSKYLS